MVENTTRARESRQRRLDRACKHVDDLWFPVNPALLKEIQDTIRADASAMSLDSLIDHVRGDLSLFAYCLRQLLLMLREEGIMPPSETNALELMRWSGIERLQQILISEDTSISAHSLQRTSPLQRARFEEALISVSTSEVLANSFELDEDFARSSAMLRQLGYVLIAWNYPDVYEKATLQIRQGITLDQAISQLLGFSPLLLAITLLRRWGARQEMVELLALPEELALLEDGSELEEIARIDDTLVNLCRIGETLARANNPSLYPSARSDWDTVVHEIQSRLGSEGLTQIRERFEESAAAYLTVAPQAFHGGMVLDPEMRFSQYRTGEIRERNPWLERCRDYLERKLSDLYQQLQEGVVAAGNVDRLTKEVIPAGGFSAGCIYTIDPGTSDLVPRLAIGTIGFSTLKPIPYDRYAACNDTVAIALRDNAISLTERRINGVPVTGIAGPIGFSQRVGVLYLEIPQMLFVQDKEQQLVHFRAIAQALNDCLALR